jgi:ABC-2 type transport system ATP-binding protein
MEFSTEALVEMDHAQRKFGDVVAVDDVTLSLRGGEILGLYGPSGAGKTTTIRLILGVHLPTAGSVRILGVPSHRLGARQREQIGYSPQQFLYPPALSAQETVSLAAGLYGRGLFGSGRTVRAILEKVDLWNKRKYRVGNMSGGERRRVGNAAALVHAPRIVFLDEPTAGLDPMLRSRMWEWFRELRDDGRALLVTGHYMAEAEFCDRVALLVNGRVTTQGTPFELRRQALGGDILEIVVGGSLSAAVDALREERAVKSVVVRERDRLWVTVHEAGPYLPLIVDRLRTRHVEISSIKEIRPPFDEIYEQLVKQSG